MSQNKHKLEQTEAASISEQAIVISESIIKSGFFLPDNVKFIPWHRLLTAEKKAYPHRERLC